MTAPGNENSASLEGQNALRVKVAELCGFDPCNVKGCECGLWFKDSEEFLLKDLPDCPNDLNACAKLISLLRDKGWTCVLENTLESSSTLDREEQWTCFFRRWHNGVGFLHEAGSDELATAICHAFIAVMEGKEK